jgi:hypothetical protein
MVQKQGSTRVHKAMSRNELPCPVDVASVEPLRSLACLPARLLWAPIVRTHWRHTARTLPVHKQRARVLLPDKLALAWRPQGGCWTLCPPPPRYGRDCWHGVAGGRRVCEAMTMVLAAGSGSSSLWPVMTPTARLPACLPIRTRQWCAAQGARAPPLAQAAVAAPGTDPWAPIVRTH